MRLTPEGRRRADLAVVDVSKAERALVIGLPAQERHTPTRGLSRLLVSVDGPPTRGPAAVRRRRA